MKLLFLFACIAFLALDVPANAQSPPEYVGSAVDLQIVPERLQAYLAAAKENAAATVKEAGNIAYVISQFSDDANHVLLFEVYKDPQAVQAHRTSEHFKKYVEATKEMVTNRQSRPLKSVSFLTQQK